MKGNADGHEFICRPGVQPRFLLAACRAVPWQPSSPGPGDPVCCRAHLLQLWPAVGAPPVGPGTCRQWALGFHPETLVEECVLPQQRNGEIVFFKTEWEAGGKKGASGSIAREFQLCHSKISSWRKLIKKWGFVPGKHEAQTCRLVGYSRPSLTV